MGDLLSTHLGDAANLGRFVRVSFDLYADTGTSNRHVYIYTPRPILRVEYVGTRYTLAISDGNNLSPDMPQNMLEAIQKKPDNKPFWENLALTMMCDGNPFGYLIAFNGTGETVYADGQEDSGGYRDELHWGRAPQDRSDYPAQDRWISSAVKNLDVALLPKGQVKGQVGGQKAAFSGQ